MDLSRGKNTVYLNRSISEKGRDQPSPCSGRPEMGAVKSSGSRHNEFVCLPIPEDREDHSGHLSADMADYIHIVQSLG